MFLYWHRTSWLDVRSNLGCLPPSPWRFSTSLALLGLRLPRHPLVHLPLQPLHLLSFSPNLLLQLPQLGVLVQTHLACFLQRVGLESNRSCGLGKCESRLNTRSWTPECPSHCCWNCWNLGNPCVETILVLLERLPCDQLARCVDIARNTPTKQM